MISRNRGQSVPVELAGQAPLELIRAWTSQCHQKLESCIDWNRAFSSPANYGQLLGRFLMAVEPLEQRIAACLSQRPSGYDEHLRTSNLQQDIRHVCDWRDAVQCSELASEAAAPEPLDMSFIDSHAAAVGSLYVLEGSALGGQYLSRQVTESRLAWPCAAGVCIADQAVRVDNYFVGRGPGTSAYWRGFCHWLNEQLQNGNCAQTAAAAANRTFGLFQECLSGNSYA